MAEDKDQRTEEATPRKREKMREEGQVIRSQDVAAAAVVIMTCLALMHTFELLGQGIAVFAQRCFRLLDVHEPLRAMRNQVRAVAPVSVTIFAASFAAAAAGAVQSRIVSLAPLVPKLDRLNPINNLSNILPSKQSLLEISKQVVKLLAVGYIGYGVIADALPRFSTLSSEPPLSAAASVASTAGTLVLRVSVALALAAAFDYWLVRRKHLEDAKMTKQEVRDEHKEQDGRPEIKQRMRRRMQEMAQQRATADVSKATVLVVNPTHYAVALRYEPQRDRAPVVLAKGIDQIALEMRSVARRSRVPVVEQKPLARALYADAKVGRTVPVELYRAVAEVIAFVMQIKARDHGQPLSPPPPQGDA